MTPEAMTVSAQAGYRGAPDRALWSSPCWLAWAAGQALASAGHPMPDSAAMSRGYSVKLTAGGKRLIVRLSGEMLDVAEIEVRQ